MRKALLIVAVLLLATPVMADTTITAVKEGDVWTAPDGNKVQTVRIDYSSDVDIRAFALDINIDSDGNSPNFQGIRDFKTGESNAASPGYGIFPSRFRDFIVVTGPVWTDPNYNPTPAWNEPETVSPRTGLGFPKMIVEMGTLYAGDANKPALSGTLFRFDVNAWGQEGLFHLSIAANALRGGVVNADGNTIAATFVGTDINFPPSCTTILNEVGQAKGTAETAWTGQGFSLNGTAVVDCTNVGLIITQDTGCVTPPYTINYTYGVQATCPNVVGLTRAAAVTALNAAGFTIASPDVNGWGVTGNTTLRNVYAQSPAPGPTCTMSVTLSVVSHPIKATAPASFYTNWVAWNRPACWASPRNCRGDTNRIKSGQFWVNSLDLTIFRSAFNKNDTQLAPVASGICADLNRIKSGQFRVNSLDLGIFRTYFNKAETAVPICGNIPLTGSTDPNYWYWCNPSTGAVCPSGQNCAPVGVCPNTP